MRSHQYFGVVAIVVVISENLLFKAGRVVIYCGFQSVRCLKQERRFLGVLVLLRIHSRRHAEFIYVVIRTVT